MKNMVIAVLCGLLIKDMPIWVVDGKNVVITLAAALIIYILLVWFDVKREERDRRNRDMSEKLNRIIATRNKSMEGKTWEKTWIIKKSH